MKKSVKVLLVAMAIVVFSSATLMSSKLGDMLPGNILKGVVLAGLTVALADQLNDAINAITLNKGVPTEAETKVVPIIAVGSGTRVGAAQVVGPKKLVENTVVVIQIETKLTMKNLDIEVFVPSDSENPLDFNRVEGVGVSALIDLRLSGI